MSKFLLIVSIVTLGTTTPASAFFVKGNSSDVEIVKNALVEIQTGTYSTTGKASNLSSFYLPYPDPKKKITTNATGTFIGESSGDNYFFTVQTTDTEDETSSFDLIKYNNKKYINIKQSSMITSDIENPFLPGIEQMYSNYLNTTVGIPEQYIGYGRFVLGQFLEGWGISRNLLHLPSLLETDGGFFVNSKTNLYTIKTKKVLNYNTTPAIKYTLRLNKTNVVPFGIEWQAKAQERDITYIEKELVKDDYGRIKDSTIILLIDKKTNKPLFLSIDLTSKDTTDKIYRNLDYSFHVEQTFLPLTTTTKIIEPQTSSLITGDVLYKIAN